MQETFVIGLSGLVQEISLRRGLFGSWMSRRYLCIGNFRVLDVQENLCIGNFGPGWMLPGNISCGCSLPVCQNKILV